LQNLIQINILQSFGWQFPVNIYTKHLNEESGLDVTYIAVKRYCYDLCLYLLRQLVLPRLFIVYYDAVQANLIEMNNLDMLVLTTSICHLLTDIVECKTTRMNMRVLCFIFDNFLINLRSSNLQPYLIPCVKISNVTLKQKCVEVLCTNQYQHTESKFNDIDCYATSIAQDPKEFFAFYESSFLTKFRLVNIPLFNIIDKTFFLSILNNHFCSNDINLGIYLDYLQLYLNLYDQSILLYQMAPCPFFVKFMYAFFKNNRLKFSNYGLITLN